MNDSPWTQPVIAALIALLSLSNLAWDGRPRRRYAEIPTVRDDSALQQRLDRAMQRRIPLEGGPEPFRIALSILGLVLAIVTFLTPTSWPIDVALAYVLLALMLSNRYLGRSGATRAASLRARTPWSVVPWYAYAAATVSALLPLLANAYPRASVVCVSLVALCIVAVAWQTASLPALITGEDPPVEEYVDTRLRTVRTLGQLTTASALSSLYWALFSDPPSIVSIWARLAQALLFAGFAIAHGIVLFRRTRTVDVLPAPAHD